MRNTPAESGEAIEPLSIVIIEPEGDKYFMIGFGNTLATARYSREQKDAYGYAIENVLEGEELRVFHQVGAGEKDGTQMWEIKTDGMTKSHLERLIPAIHAKATEYAEEMVAF